MKLSGTVKEKKIAPGSKSERIAIVLETDDAEYVLRQPGKNPLAKDEELVELVGSKMECQGTIHGQYFLVSSFKSLDD